ncbi:MAG: cysteine hydrolase family protein [Bacteroidales bacterium]
MRKILILTCFLFSINLMAQTKMNKDTALLIIDVQNFYYPGGKSELVNPEPAGENAAKLLDYFRKKGMFVVHVRHNSEPGGEIHKDVKPIEGEKIISKDEVNCFKNTDLLEFLKSKNIKCLVICGMQTHMCVEAATRAASDFDYDCIVVHDACATKNLIFNNKEVKAEDVHNSTLATLKSYAKVVDTESIIGK